MSTIGSTGFYAAGLVGSIAGSRQSETAPDRQKGVSAQSDVQRDVRELGHSAGEVDEADFEADRDADGHGEWGGQGSPDNADATPSAEVVRTVTRSGLTDDGCGHLLDLEG